MDPDYAEPWYHGSPTQLTLLRPGSTITQDRELARIFSHKPSLVVQNIDNDGHRSIKHAGERPGFLYRIAQPVAPQDVTPHPQTTMAPGQEWLITRALRVEIIGPTTVNPAELLTREEIQRLRRRTGA